MTGLRCGVCGRDALVLVNNRCRHCRRTSYLIPESKRELDGLEAQPTLDEDERTDQARVERNQDRWND